MTTVGIVAEYNPFHNGHAYQIDCIRKKISDAVIVICMSGSITQRGEAALLDKWTRAELAINGGADLVLELPFVFACRSAQDFASGAIRLLSDLHVDILAFGAEIGELAPLQHVAQKIDSPAFQGVLYKYIRNGNSYAAAFEKACCSKGFDLPHEMLRQPNNILAIEYLRVIHKLGKKNSITPLLISRKGNAYHDTNLTAFSSASAIREELKNLSVDWDKISQALPSQVFSQLIKFPRNKMAYTENLYRPFLLRLYTSQLLTTFYGYQEGVENRFLRVAKTTFSREEFLQKASTKRYSKSRISRLMTYALLEVNRDFISQVDMIGPQYIRPLAMNRRGMELLHHLKRNTRLTILTKPARYNKSTKSTAAISKSASIVHRMLFYDIQATHLRNLATDRLNLPDDYTHSPSILL